MTDRMGRRFNPDIRRSFHYDEIIVLWCSRS